MTEDDKARDRVESGDSGRQRNAAIRAQSPTADRMDFFNGLLKGENFYNTSVGKHPKLEVEMDTPTRFRDYHLTQQRCSIALAFCPAEC